MKIKNKISRLVKLTENRLNELTTMNNVDYEKIFKSMNYSLMAGGKRIRPLLSYATCDCIDLDYEKIIDFACAIEMIHTYSLIHDDLPAMDDDEYRRGKLTNHKVFGEGIAILTGDGLLNYAASILVKNSLEKADFNYLKSAKYILESSGINGMIAGQVLDIETQGDKLDKTKLENMHRLKTGQLIKASICFPLIIAKREDLLEKFEKLAYHIGIAFQIRDDLLDVEGDFKELGKNINQDIKHEKYTYVTAYGVNEAKRKLIENIEEAIDILKDFEDKNEFMNYLSLLIARRNK